MMTRRVIAHEICFFFSSYPFSGRIWCLIKNMYVVFWFYSYSYIISEFWSELLNRTLCIP